MTADKLQDIVRVLANGSWCRYWLNLYDDGYRTMAIQCRDYSGNATSIYDAEKHGFKECENYLYIVPRTNEDGTPYESMPL